MKLLVFLGCHLLLLVSSIYSATWNGITPLRSSRADVERILGRENEHGYYQTAEGKVRILYGADVKDADTCWGRASKDVVTEIAVDLDAPWKFEKLGIDMSKFKKVVSPENSDSAQFTDWKSGIAYVVELQDGLVYSIYYYPNESDCRSILKKVSS